MSTLDYLDCHRCGCVTQVNIDHGVPETIVCAVCLKLGHRSLVWLLGALRRATGDERQEIHALFKAARGRSWMEDDVRRYLATPRSKRRPMPPGLLQLARERRRDE